jgi:glucokinase
MKHAIGIDVGGTNVKLGLTDERGKLLDTLQVPTRAETNDQKRIVSNLIQAVRDLLERNPSVKPDAIGLGIPGGVLPKEGKVTFLPNIPALTDCAIARDMEQAFRLPTFVDNDANNAARGEFVFGAAKGLRHFIAITLGTGIGGGIFINGDIYDGTINYSGEIGHMVVVPNGRRCGCGNFGCWEAYGSATAMLTKARSMIDRGVETSLSRYSDADLNIKILVDEAKAGDEVAAAIFDEAMQYVGVGIASLVNVFNPEALIVGGGISLAGEWMLSKVRVHARMNAMPKVWETVHLCLAELGNHAGVLGSAALAFMESGKR